jgi:hypothetical protein
MEVWTAAAPDSRREAEPRDLTTEAKRGTVRALFDR